MTSTELKQLAEWSAEFLGMSQCDSRLWWPNNIEYMPRLDDSELTFAFFELDETAPILMHLGKREMTEKRGYFVRCDHYENCHRVFIRSERDDSGGDWQLSPVFEDNENEYIAFWTAVREALK